MQSQTFFRLSLALVLLVSFFVIIVIGNNLFNAMRPPVSPAADSTETSADYMEISNERMVTSAGLISTLTTLISTSTKSPEPHYTSPYTKAFTDSLPRIVIKAPFGTIRARVAASDYAREQGLSDRTVLGTTSGMLFVFETPSRYSFWMKDMNFSLDMVWILPNKTVQTVSANLSPDSYPKVFKPSVPVLYVLELNSGAAAKLGIATGTKLVF